MVRDLLNRQRCRFLVILPKILTKNYAEHLWCYNLSLFCLQHFINLTKKDKNKDGRSLKRNPGKFCGTQGMVLM